MFQTESNNTTNKHPNKSLLAASVWGNWENYKRVWKSTANGLEGAAALFNDGLLALDENGDSEAKVLSDSL